MEKKGKNEGNGLHVVILAAGQGTRMKSSLPKVLQDIAGKPMLERVIDTAISLNPDSIKVVVGHKSELIKQAIHAPVTWYYQDKQLGTAHAIKVVADDLPSNGRTLVLYGDVPLIDTATLHQLLKIPYPAVALLSDCLEDPTGYGRIVRDEKGSITAICEEGDATFSEKVIKEINTGIYVFPNTFLHEALPQIQNNNAKQEYYLTDAIALAYCQGIAIYNVRVKKHYLAAGVNDKVQLATLERIYQKEKAHHFMQEGLTIRDPERVDFRGFFTFGCDCTIDINCLFIGKVALGERVSVGAHCVLKNVHIGNNVIIAPFSHLEDCVVQEGARIGPYARLRPGAKIEPYAHIGNFVEIKNSVVGQESKVNHLTYIGDATIGEHSNIGAGTVTCNYDGVNKYHSEIGDYCFVGSGVMLVAPVKVGNGATLGAGSVITKDCPEEKLTLARAKQLTITHWKKASKRD